MNDKEPNDEQLHEVIALLSDDEKTKLTAALKRVTEDENRNTAFLQLSQSHMHHMRVLQHTKPKAYGVLMAIISFMNKTNVAMLDHSEIAELSFCSISTVKTALTYLAENNWIEITKHGTARFYAINSRIVWKSTPQRRRAVFNATIVLSTDQQQLLGSSYQMQQRLRHVPLLEKPHKNQTIILRDDEIDQQELDV
jgi:DNA-binding MarR family transcriptional regulator